MKKRFPKILMAIGLVFIAIQFIRPNKNQATDISDVDISKVYATPDDVKQILAKACNDCHSNNTIYPWYNNIQPVAWWLNNHVKDGKRHLNFSEFASYRIARQYKKLDECKDEVKQGEMPLDSYTWIHKKAILTEEEKLKLFTWIESIQATMKAKYPPDSLIITKHR